MKKSILLAGGCVAAALVMSGCAGVSVGQGGVGALSAGPNFYSEVSANALIMPVAKADFTVVKRDVKASAELKSSMVSTLLRSP